MRAVRALTTALSVPFWPFEVFSAKKSFAGAGALGRPGLNRRGLHAWRTKLASDLAWRRRRHLAGKLDPADRAAFDAQGYLERRDFLPAGEFRALLAEVMALEADALEQREGNAVTRHIPVTPAVRARAPALDRLVRSPAFQGPIRYAGSFDMAPAVFVQTVFAGVDGGGRDPQTDLHIDTFHPTVKAWLFLEDVAAEDGPFRYVAGSHLLNPRRLAWHKRRSIRATRPGGPKGGAFRVRADELHRLGYGAPTSFAVPANTLVVGDTFGIHGRSPSRRASKRIEIFAYSRPNPFLPWARHPFWSLRWAGDRQAAWHAAALRLARRLGLQASGWRPVGTVDPLAPPRGGAAASRTGPRAAQAAR